MASRRAKKPNKQNKNEEDSVEEVKKEIRTGSSSFLFKDGSEYIGGWVDNGDGRRLKHGKGILKTSKGLHYDGDWHSGQKHGIGKCKYPTGNIYEGRYAEGHFEGEGKMVWRNGTLYQGEWKRGKMSGRGEFIDEKGNRFRGVFRNNKFISNTGFFISCKDSTVPDFEVQSFLPRTLPKLVRQVILMWFPKAVCLRAQMKEVQEKKDGGRKEKADKKDKYTTKKSKGEFKEPMEAKRGGGDENAGEGGETQEILIDDKAIEETEKLYSGLISEEKKKDLIRNFGIALELPDEIWRVCKDSKNPEYGLSFLLIFGPLRTLLKGKSVDKHLRMLLDSMAKMMATAGDELTALKSVFLYAAMATTEDKDISDKGMGKLEAMAEDDHNSFLQRAANRVLDKVEDQADIISHFGRDPRLNKEMQREETPEESKWLEDVALGKGALKKKDRRRKRKKGVNAQKKR
ncbi:hypothetical protein AAMO2058_000994700 [Amorphochlora amoebiformis]